MSNLRECVQMPIDELRGYKSSGPVSCLPSMQQQASAHSYRTNVRHPGCTSMSLLSTEPVLIFFSRINRTRFPRCRERERETKPARREKTRTVHWLITHSSTYRWDHLLHSLFTQMERIEFNSNKLQYWRRVCKQLKVNEVMKNKTNWQTDTHTGPTGKYAQLMSLQ